MSDIRVPAHVQPIVSAVGVERAIDFLLAFGGSYIYLSENPQERSPVQALIGRDAAIKLAKELGSGSLRCPTAKPFIAQHFKYNKGMTTNAIARKLHSSDVSVRGWLKPQGSTQMDLFGG